MKPANIWLQALRWLRLMVHLLRGAGIVALLFPFSNPTQQRALRQRWSGQLLHCLGVGLSLPQLVPNRGELLVSNHISWLDIFVFNACAAIDFVAKDEVQHWYFFGWLARKNGTLFLPRYSPLQVQALNVQLLTRLQSGESVLVFPEGTTSTGLGVLPFHPALFQAAIDANCGVQTLALQYTNEAGQRSTAPAYAGEITIWQSLCSIIASTGLQAQVQVCPRLLPDDAQRQRRRLANSARALVLEATQGQSLNTATSQGANTTIRQPSQLQLEVGT